MYYRHTKYPWWLEFILPIALCVLCVLAMFAKADIQADVEFLASDALRGRAYGSPGILSAQNYIIAALTVEGITVSRQKVDDCQNVIAFIGGAKPETYIVVGAHLDHMGVIIRQKKNYIQNGADDNASGSAAILELAKRIKKAKTLRSVVFVWFTGEETGFRGSRAFVKNPYGGKPPVFMLNLDMVGRLKDGGANSRTNPGELVDLFEKYPFARRITNRGSNRGSDHRSFNGICPTLFLNTGLHDIYHTSRDDADTLDYEGIQKVCDYSFDLIMRTCGRKHEYNLMRKP